MIESGELANISLPLADDPCTKDGIDSSECCHYDVESNQCVITFIGWKTFPCQLCDLDNSNSTQTNTTNTNTNTTNTTEPTEETEETTCACLEYYPHATMSTPTWEYGNATSLDNITNHECRDTYYNDGVDGGSIVNFAQCCEYDYTSNQCGIVRDGVFTSPCGSCTIKTKMGTRTLSTEIIMALVGGTVLILLVIACWFWKNRARPQNIRELARKANEQLNHTHTNTNNDHNGSQSQMQDWTSLPIGGGVFDDNNDGEIVATPVGVAAPVVSAEVLENGVNMNMRIHPAVNANAVAVSATPIPMNIPVAVPNN